MDLWSRVRDTFVNRLEDQARSLGLVTEKHGLGKVHGDWMAVKCPLCTDSGGSASLSIKSGQLVCKQCGANDPLFDWLQKRSSFATAWDACQDLAKQLGLDMPAPGKRTKTQPKLTQGTVDQFVTALWSAEEAGHLRKALLERGFSQTELAGYFLGFDGQSVVFPRIENGDVFERCHRWHGPHAKPKWSWNKAVSGGAATNYYWPAHILPDLDASPNGSGEHKIEVWVCEGEWDCLILREKLGKAAYTWTGGVTSSPTPSQVPEWLRGAHVVLVCDNDTWQGVGREWAPSDKALRELRARRLRFLEHARILSRFAASVEIATVPVSPEELWGGDVRDWYGKGGRDLLQFPRCDLAAATKEVVEYVPCSIREAAAHPETHVEFVAQAAGLDSRAELWRPDATVCECGLGAHKCCAQCRLPGLSREGILHWVQDRTMSDLMAGALVSPDPTKFIEKHVIGKPKNCPSLTLHHSKEGRPVTTWLASDRETVFGTELLVLSEQIPQAYEDMRVKGRVLNNIEELNTFVLAHDVKIARGEKVDLEPFDKTLKELCPHDSDSDAVVSEFLKRRFKDLACHVTLINNLDLIRMFDLISHSARRFRLHGNLVRAWLDGCIVGVTRCGKTETCKLLHSYYGEGGQRISTQSNFSLAGLVAGNVKGKSGTFRVAPGLFPRNHKRMIVMDEVHLMNDAHKYGSVFSNIQEIRDCGIAGSLKVAGGHQLPAEVRLLCIGNPPNGLFERYLHKCEAFAELYGDNPEFLSRMDIGLVVTAADQEAAASPPEIVGQAWTQELCTALRQRAWDIDPDDISFDPGVWTVTEKAMQSWSENLDQEMPLFCGPDRRNTILRVAIAIANLCYSHDDNAYKCVVRPVHARLAVNIMEEHWERCDYFRFSSQKNVGIGNMIWVAEYGLVRGLSDTNEATTVLSGLLSLNTRNDLMTIVGLDFTLVDKWLARMFSAKVLMLRKPRRGMGGHTGYSPTKEGALLIHKLIGLAQENPEEFQRRRTRLAAYFITDLYSTPRGDPHGLDSLLDETPF